MKPSAAAGLADRVMDILNNTTKNTEPLPPIREAMDTMMEHIDEKMTRLQMYHRVINDIATALGYRMGDTFEPEALVNEVKHLVAEQDMVIAACRGTQMDTGGIRAVKELTNRTVKAESILAALRKPSDTMLNAMSVAAEKANVWVNTAPITSQELQNRLWIAGMNAAIAVAEQEVNDGISG